MLVIGVVVLAAALHASWNAIVKSVADRLAVMAVIGATSTVVCVPVALLAASPRAASLPFMAGSVAAHTVYNLLLIACYRDGDFNQVYPVARGISPPTVAVCAVLFVGESLGPLQTAGLAVLTAGLLAVATGRGRTSRRGVAFAVVTGLTIAGYTVLDGIGVRRSGTALGYTGWLFVAEGSVMPIVWALRAVGPAAMEPDHHSDGQTPSHLLWRGAVAGGLSVLAYGLVLWAQTRGALAVVAALRETSVVFAALIGASVLGDGLPVRRMLASVLIAAGAVALAAG